MTIETRLTPELIAANTAAGYWRNETLDVYLDRWARARADKTAAVDASGRFTWSQLARMVERVAYGLAEHGIGAGSVISCQLPNWTEFVVLALAATRLGAILNPIPPTYRANELRFMLEVLEAQALVVPQRFRGSSACGSSGASPERTCCRSPRSSTRRGRRGRDGARSPAPIPTR